jgi:hypothetical protein
MKQVLQMIWTRVIGDKKVTCALVTEWQEDLVLIRALKDADKLRAAVDRTSLLDPLGTRR